MFFAYGAPHARLILMRYIAWLQACWPAVYGTVCLTDCVGLDSFCSLNAMVPPLGKVHRVCNAMFRSG